MKPFFVGLLIGIIAYSSGSSFAGEPHDIQSSAPYLFSQESALKSLKSDYTMYSLETFPQDTGAVTLLMNKQEEPIHPSIQPSQCFALNKQFIHCLPEKQ